MIKDICVLLLIVCLHSATGHQVQYTALSFGKDTTSYISLEKYTNPLSESPTHPTEEDREDEDEKYGEEDQDGEEEEEEEYDVNKIALTFGKDATSYISLDKYTNPLSESFSVCSWVKRERHDGSGTYQYWISYAVNQNNFEFGIADSGYSYLHNDATTYRKSNQTIGEWHHICKTWSFSKQERFVYYDGKVIGSEMTPIGRKLHVPGTFLLGQFHRRIGEAIYEHRYFGGTLYDTNIFSIQLSASQVKEIFNQGRCGKYSSTFGEDIFLGWDDILQQPKNGNVTEITLEVCYADHTHPTEEDWEDEDEKDGEEDQDGEEEGEVEEKEEEQDVKKIALSFGKDATSYISLDKYTNPLSESFSVCSWVKRERHDGSGTYQYWISYAVNQNNFEFGIADSGYSYLHNDATTYRKPNQTIGEWHHICKTWSFSKQERFVYYDGEVVGSEMTPIGRKLHVPGSFLLGQFHRRIGEAIYEHRYFGGTLYDTNIFSIQLSASQVKEIFNQGRCGKYSSTFGEGIFLGWNEILLKERKGNVSEISLEECNIDLKEKEEEKEEEGKDEDKGTAGNCTSTWEFLRNERFFKMNITVELLLNIKDQFKLLEEFKNRSINNALIGHLKEHHFKQPAGNETKGETGEEAEKVTDWEFLTEDPFFNKIVTEELLLDVTKSLDLLAEFIGHCCDEALIQHLNKHHSHCKFEKL